MLNIINKGGGTKCFRHLSRYSRKISGNLDDIRFNFIRTIKALLYMYKIYILWKHEAISLDIKFSSYTGPYIFCFYERIRCKYEKWRRVQKTNYDSSHQRFFNSLQSPPAVHSHTTITVQVINYYTFDIFLCLYYGT